MMERYIPTLDIIKAVKGVLDTVPGIDQVDIQEGNQLAWTRLKRRAFMWLVEMQSLRQITETVPGRRRVVSVRREIQVCVDGWYPADEAANTNADWVQKVALVKQTLHQKDHFAGKVLLTGFPEQEADDYQLKTSLHQGDLPTLCHYGRIILPLIDGYDLETL